MWFTLYLVCMIVLSPLFFMSVVWWEYISPWLKNRKYKEQKGYEMTREEFLNECRDSSTPSMRIDNNTSVMTLEHIEFLVNLLFDEIEKNKIEHDLKTKSDENGYVSVLGCLGRMNPNTVYKVYVEEVENV